MIFLFRILVISLLLAGCLQNSSVSPPPPEANARTCIGSKGTIEAATDPPGGQQPEFYEVENATGSILLEAWLNVSGPGPYAIADVANALAGPFVGIYAPEATSPLGMIRFPNRAGVAPLEHGLGAGKILVDAIVRGNWFVHFAGIGSNVQVDFVLTHCH